MKYWLSVMLVAFLVMTLGVAYGTVIPPRYQPIVAGEDDVNVLWEDLALNPRGYIHYYWPGDLDEICCEIPEGDKGDILVTLDPDEYSKDCNVEQTIPIKITAHLAPWMQVWAENTTFIIDIFKPGTYSIPLTYACVNTNAFARVDFDDFKGKLESVAANDNNFIEYDLGVLLQYEQNYMFLQGDEIGRWPFQTCCTIMEFKMRIDVPKVPAGEYVEEFNIILTPSELA